LIHHFQQGGLQAPIIKWGLRNFGRTNPIRLGMAARPREFGEQTEEVLAEFGFGADEVAQLRQARDVRVSARHEKSPGKPGPFYFARRHPSVFGDDRAL
jgi:hypothetical protein